MKGKINMLSLVLMDNLQESKYFIILLSFDLN